ncbi:MULTISPECIES: MlaC/ttg2D family ABC transporter substrate-binding protein [Thiorhodovibrio]|uniref:MlaC/ttg2D family ABC transporter substrate-binding protein n=1 Tax=Thiorhodovibrio TaxID=61593 RepID=UPI0019127248|nr:MULTISPECIES: ABC transporter substrate-binding protein [Thiorhodovibrio]MBK5967250.1 toluene tolerance protein [Thiorhodovibrio winogradskyi]WPL14496.1 putative phospholipid-binding protein MlaC precursor [Thiorhodovibrio litoralis]
MKTIKLFALSALLMLVAVGTSLAQGSATDLVRNTAEKMLSTLEAQRAEVDRRPQLIYELVGRVVAPHFDFELITQSTVGRDWRQATPAQRKALVDAFREVLVRTYATALLKYSGEEIVYQPAKPGTRDGTVIVPTQVRAPGSSAIPIDYRLHDRQGSWKVYDVVIDNVSLISNYRNQFRSIIGRDGIDGLIQELRAKSHSGS